MCVSSSSKIIILLFVFFSFLFHSSCSNNESRIKKRQLQDNEPSLPSNLPSPPKVENISPPSSSSPSNSDHGTGNLFTRVPPITPPHIFPAFPPGANPFPQPPPPFGNIAPFGFTQTILILVPQFKLKVQNLPKWFGSNVKYSFPITVFFDQLDTPVGSPVIHFGSFFNMKFMNKRSVNNANNSNIKIEKKPLPPLHSIRGGERAQLFPKLENILNSIGLEKNCLLRAVCEVNEPIGLGLGLLGEIMELVFSISRSNYADSHLPEYKLAEERGKSGNCSEYTTSCSESMFYWHNK